MAYLYLAVAIIAEVIATSALKASVELTRRGDRLDGKLTRAQRDQAGDAAGLAANSRPHRQALLEFLVADGLGKYIDHNHTGYN